MGTKAWEALQIGGSHGFGLWAPVGVMVCGGCGDGGTQLDSGPYY